MVPTITNPITQLAGSVLLAIALLCLSAAILRADEPQAGPKKHCRMYFGCLPDLAKMHGRFN
jgi:hypothetical protein